MAKRCLARPSEDPPFEYVLPSKSLQRGFFFANFLLCSTFASQTRFPVLIMVLSAALSATGFAISIIDIRKHTILAETVNAIWFAIAISLGHFIVFSLTNDLIRVRSAACVIMVTKHVPAWFAFRSSACFLYLIFSLLLDWANGYLMSLHYGDVYTIQMATNAFMWTCLYMFIAFAQLRWIGLMYKVETDLKAEKTAMERLLSILCDCQVWLHANGDTVLRSNPLFDSLAGRAMEGTQIRDETLLSEEDDQRLEDAFERAIEAPVILPISIRSKSCKPKDVEFLIVKRGQANTFARWKHKAHRGFGATDINENGLFSFLVGIRISDAGQLGPTCDKDAANEFASVPSDFGQEQDGIDVQPALYPNSATENPVVNMDDVRCDGRPVDNLTTVTGRAFESLGTALEIGDRNSMKRSVERIARTCQMEKWLVPLSDVSLLPTSVLGYGGFGIVICGTVCGTSVAVKLVRAQESLWKRKLQSLPNELRILRGIRHPNVVQFLGACLDVDNVEIGLIFERVLGICMNRFVRGSPKTPVDTGNRHALICDISGALRFLHARRPPIVHADLKPSNVLVESIYWEGAIRPKAKILDFGLARFAASGAKAAGGTLQWIAPEIIRDPEIVLAPSADVYSFGHIILFLNTGKKPREDVSREEIVYRAKLNVQDELVWPDGVQPFATNSQQLVADCVSIDAHLRPPMEQVHVDILSWKTYHTTKQSPSHKEATWIEGLEIVRARTTAGTSKKCL